MAINKTPPPLSILVMDLKSLNIDSRATCRRCCHGYIGPLQRYWSLLYDVRILRRGHHFRGV